MDRGTREGAAVFGRVGRTGFSPPLKIDFNSGNRRDSKATITLVGLPNTWRFDRIGPPSNLATAPLPFSTEVSPMNASIPAGTNDPLAYQMPAMETKTLIEVSSPAFADSESIPPQIFGLRR
jgi:hypothetical protein